MKKFTYNFRTTPTPNGLIVKMNLNTRTTQKIVVYSIYTLIFVILFGIILPSTNTPQIHHSLGHAIAQLILTTGVGYVTCLGINRLSKLID